MTSIVVGGRISHKAVFREHSVFYTTQYYSTIVFPLDKLQVGVNVHAVYPCCSYTVICTIFNESPLAVLYSTSIDYWYWRTHIHYSMQVCFLTSMSCSVIFR